MSRLIILLLVASAIFMAGVFAWSLIRYANDRDKRKYKKNLTEKKLEHEKNMKREERDYDALIESIEEEDI